jgi:hypothetical protein
MRIPPLMPIRNIKERLPEKFSVCDIESAAGWVNFLIIGLYDGERYQDFTTLYEFFKCLEEGDNRTVYAHFGGRYDFMFLLESLFDNQKFIVTSMIPRGSGILSFDAVSLRTGVKITFRDSSAMLPYGLRSLCENFNVKHQKLDVDYDSIKVVTPELREYLRHDCIGLHECIERYFEWDLIRDSGPAYTIAGQAMKVLRLFIQDPIPGLSPTVDAFVRKGYFGGRTEIFKPLFEASKSKKKLYCFDVNSLYPTVMRAFDYPGRFLRYSYKYEPNEIGFYDATVDVPDGMYIPPLGVVHEMNGSTKFVFPTGRFSGRWSTAELEYAKTLGVKIISTGKGAIFENAGPIFRDFVDALYLIRQNSPRESVANVLAKLILNSCYGRFALQREREIIEMDMGQLGAIPLCEIGPKNRRTRLVKIPKEVDSFTNVAVAAWVTSQARIHMHKIYLQCQDELYYTDTDSLFTTKYFEDEAGLGALKLEYEIDDGACFLLPKTYRAGKKVVMKGFDKKKIQHFTHEDFLTALEGDLRRLKIVQASKFATFRTALKKQKLVTMVEASTREIRSQYDKRTVFKIGKHFDTKPLHIDG